MIPVESFAAHLLKLIETCGTKVLSQLQNRLHPLSAWQNSFARIQEARQDNSTRLAPFRSERIVAPGSSELAEPVVHLTRARRPYRTIWTNSCFWRRPHAGGCREGREVPTQIKKDRSPEILVQYSRFQNGPKGQQVSNCEVVSRS